MENQPPLPQNKTGSILLIGLFLLMLLSGGIGIWYFTRPEEEETPEVPSDKEKSVTGTLDYTNSLTTEEIISGQVNDPTKSALFAPNQVIDNKTIYIKDPKAQEMILLMAKELAKSDEVVGKLKARIGIGRIFQNGVKYTSKAQGAISHMFTFFQNVIKDNPNTYPIFSTWQIGGKDIQNQLQNFVDKGWERLNLSQYRAGGNPEYITALDLNLYYLKRGITTHSVDQIRWHKADQGGLDLFKELNGHDVGNIRLTEHSGGKAHFPAAGAWNFARDWISQIDLLDEELKKEARLRLEKAGWTFSITPLNA